MDFTSEQNKIFHFVKYDSNNGIIDAVAGSGKTTTIIESATHVANDKTVLFCAFNKSIAREIQRKFSEKGLNRIKVKTLHALGYDILKSNSQSSFKFHKIKYVKIIHEAIENNALRKELENLFKINGIPTQAYSRDDKAQQNEFIYAFRNTLLDINTKFRLTLCKGSFEDFREMLLHFNIFNEIQAQSELFDLEVEQYFLCNQVILEIGNRLAQTDKEIDFSDMLYLPFVQGLFPITKHDVLFIDECQDLSKSQLAVALKYVKKTGRILSVGDPYQSIYGFTGADIYSFDNIAKIPNMVSLQLTKCFRCPDKIIELAQNFRADIHAFKPKSGTISRLEFSQVSQSVSPHDLVISRTKTPLQKLLFQLVEKGIPVEVHEDEIKEFINDLKMLFNHQELTTKNQYGQSLDFWDKVIDRNIYFLEKKVSRIGNPDEREYQFNLESSLIHSKVEFIQSQLSIHTDCQAIADLLKKIETLISGTDDAVKLSTIHRAKGLENEVIYILEYDRLPLTRDGQKDWEIKQELNLKYVALTRSKNVLYLVNSERRPNKDHGSLFEDMEGLW